MDQSSPPPPPPPKSAIPRRGPPLTAIRTDLAQQPPLQQQQQQQQQQRTRPVLQKPRPQRLRPTEVVANQPQNVPLQSESTKRIASKTSLRGLFARNKALREERKTEITLPAVGERRGSTTPSTTVPDTPRSIAHTFASGSTLHAPSQVATPTESTFNLDRPSRSTRVKPEAKSKVSSSWTPPPLFQAYPQASKHARLAVPNISPDTVLRIQATQAGNFRNPSQPGEGEGGDASAAKKGKKDTKDKNPVKRGRSNTLDQIVLLKKIFVLVTAGYLLQYTGEGSYDRPPEKIMRLGPASAAFASDSIPGKHHVVQISQKSTNDGTAPAAAGRTFLSRFGLQTAESRRSVRTFLVIMSSAQEMNNWLIALRKTIESLGGKKYVPELTPGDYGEAPEVPSNTLLSHRGSRLLASRKSSLRSSNPPSPLSDTFPVPSSAASTHRKSLYQEEEQEQQPRIPSPVKTSNRLSISGPLDIVMIPSTISTFGDSDIIFENPRQAPRPTQQSKTTPPMPPSVETPAQSPAVTPRLRKPLSTSSNTNRRSLTSYTATQLERQGEVARASRPLSFVGNGPRPAATSRSSSPPPQNTSIPGPNVRLSLLQGDSSQLILSDDGTSRKTPTIEPASKVSNRTVEQTPTSNIGIKRDSIINTQKRQSLISSSRSATPTTNSAIATARTIPTIPPRKYSLMRTESSESVTAASGNSRSYQQNRLPDMNHTPRLPQQRVSQLTQSRLPSVTEKGRPLTRLPKINSDSSESTTPTSTPPPSNLARFALGKDRANRVSASTTKVREPQDRSASALSHRQQQPRQTTTTSVSEDQPGLQSRTTTPASSPQTPQTPREESSRRSSLITSQPQSQQTSPRARRNPNLSFLPPAPPPNMPLPEAPPPNIAFRHIPLWQKRHLQQPSHPPQSQLPQPPPLQPQQQTQQTHLPRPSISSSSLTSATSSPAPPPATASAANQQHTRRRSSELRSLHLQMANMLNNSIMHRKQSDVSLAGTTTATTTTTATNTANATPTSEFPPLNLNLHLNPQRRSQSPQKRNEQ